MLLVARPISNASYQQLRKLVDKRLLFVALYELLH
jgi:hypothetical protein